MVDEPRVCAIGLDAADGELVDSLLAAGELPHLARLRDRSAVARLEHRDHRTGLAWEHFVTGRSAAGNQRWSAVSFDPETYEVWQEGAQLVPSFLASAPVTSVVFDVPYTSRACPLPGVHVTGWGGHDPGYPPGSNPPGLYREIVDRFGVHPASGNDYDITWHRPDAIDALADGLVLGCRRRADIVTWLTREVPDWRLLVTVLSEPHSANEQFWHGVDGCHPIAGVSGEQAGLRLREVYRAVDDAVGRILAALDDEVSVIVFSLHGGGPNHADTQALLLLPELLHRLHGRPARLHDHWPAWEADGCPSIVPPAPVRWPRFAEDLYESRGAIRRRRARERAGAAARGVLDDLGRRRPSLGPVGVLGRSIPVDPGLDPAAIGVPRSSIAWQPVCRYRDEWPSMRFFALPTFYDGRVRVNLVGRERDGRVALAGYERTLDEIEQELRACRDARTGAPVVADVRRLRLDDPLAPDGPDADLEILFQGYADAWVHPSAGRIGPVPFRRTGGHRANGFAFVSGPGIGASDLGCRDALDVPATILSMLHGGPPAEAAVDGSPLVPR